MLTGVMHYRNAYRGAFYDVAFSVPELDDIITQVSHRSNTIRQITRVVHTAYDK